MTTPDDTDLLLLDGDWGSLGVTRLGATVSSWRPRGVERLFTAGDATPALGRMWQGGIPVCAPWFGQAVGQGWAVPWSHGLVSRVRWDVVGVSDAAHEARVSLTTDAAATAHLPGADRFPLDLRYRLDIAADDRSLTMALTVASPTADAVIDAVFHPYLAADARGEAAEGLEGVAFHDYATGADGVDRSPVPLAGPIDRVYAGARPVVLPGAELRMDARGADTVVVWNPGPGTSKVPADEWADFACVEYGALARPIPAGGELAIALTLTVR
jgi:glucose-6-phosphate 1-epimerase